MNILICNIAAGAGLTGGGTIVQVDHLPQVLVVISTVNADDVALDATLQQIQQ